MIKTFALLVAFSLPPAPAAAQGTRIGAAAAVAGLVKAVAPGAVGRVVESGKPLFLNDHVTSDGKGRLQVLLLDETVFTIGPNSDMVLDEFVYDPATSAGKVTARVTKGVFRFVTGKVARRTPENMKVNLPVGTIGIRGTIALGETTETKADVILVGPGADNNTGDGPGMIAVSGEGGGGPVVLDRPGFGTTLEDGKDPGVPSDMTALAEKLSASLEPKPEEGKPDSGAGGESASQQSGDASARGEVLSRDTAQTSQTSGDNASRTNAAFQDAAEGGAVADGVSSWDQLRSIESGIFSYLGSGSYACSTALCGSPTTAPMNFQLDVDFGARQLTYLQLILQGTMSFSGGASTGLQAPISFANLQGDAALTLSSGELSDPNFAGTGVKFENAAGVIASDVAIDVKYQTSNTNATATGLMTGPKGNYNPQ